MHKGPENRHRLHPSTFQKPFKFNALFSHALDVVRRGTDSSLIEIPIDEALLIRMGVKAASTMVPMDPDCCPPPNTGRMPFAGHRADQQRKILP